MKLHLFCKSLIILCFCLTIGTVKAQVTPRRVIQVSGLVVGGDSLYGIPGVHVYIPKAGRGTVTSAVGYFSLPVLQGDSLVIRSLGFKEKWYVVPHENTDQVSVIIQLNEDTTLLPEVEIFPYPTERLFKEAFMSLKLPEADMDNMHKNLNDQVLKRMMYNTAPSGSQMHAYYMQQQIQKQDYKYMSPTFNFLNPFAWNQFIQSVKKGGLKKKKYEEEDDDEEENAKSNR